MVEGDASVGVPGCGAYAAAQRRASRTSGRVCRTRHPRARSNQRSDAGVCRIGALCPLFLPTDEREDIMRRLCVVVVAVGLALAAAPAYAGSGNPSPSGTGPPSQSCQDQVASGGTEPGHASSSPGSPFNEPSSTSNGGTGGPKHRQKSQYRVGRSHPPPQKPRPPQPQG